MEQLFGTLKEIQTDVSDIKTDVAVIKTDVGYHVNSLKTLREEFKPVQDHVAKVNGVFKFIGGVAVVAGLVATLISIFK